MDEKLTLSIRQFALAWRTMCSRAPGYVAASVPGIELIFSRLPSAFFNVAVLTDSVASADQLRALAAESTAWAEGKQVPWFLVVTHESLAAGLSAESILQDAGFVPAVNLTGMLADDVEPAAGLPDGLRIETPSDDASSAAMVTVNAAAYGMNMDDAVPVLGSHAFWKDHFAAVGLVGDMPVACTGVLMIEGFRYVAFVATHPDYRRRGFADAVMRVALQAAEKKPTVLHATDAGFPVYQKMGYGTIATHTAFLLQRFAVGH